MYDIILSIIGNSPDQQIVVCIAGALIIIISCVLIDLVYRVFSHFWR